MPSEADLYLSIVDKMHQAIDAKAFKLAHKLVRRLVDEGIVAWKYSITPNTQMMNGPHPIMNFEVYDKDYYVIGTHYIRNQSQYLKFRPVSFWLSNQYLLTMLFLADDVNNLEVVLKFPELQEHQDLLQLVDDLLPLDISESFI